MSAKSARPITPPICLECGATASLTTSDAIYPHRPDLSGLPMWQCSCGAYTGCHHGTERPKGRPAGSATRKARAMAHKYFDPLWKAKAAQQGTAPSKARARGYHWLARSLNIDPKDCHIGLMSAEIAGHVIALCKKIRRKNER